MLMCRRMLLLLLAPTKIVNCSLYNPFFFLDVEQGAGSREQGAGSREQRAESRLGEYQVQSERLCYEL